MTRQSKTLGIAALAALAAGTALFGQSSGAHAVGQGCCAPPTKSAGTRPVQARTENGVQKATITIDGGYTPAAIAVKAGKPVQLTFIRKETSGCGNVVRFPGLNIERTLAAGEKTVVTFTPKKSGTTAFTCGMGMYRGEAVAK